jgi:NitT/TauT family transport system substrate-binding protein
LLAATTAAVDAETGELRISKQPGLQYLPLLVMEQNRLVEKYARAMGLGDVKVSWVYLTSGGTAVDALLSGNIDMVGSGISNLLVAWSGTSGQIKGVAPLAQHPILFVSKNPSVKTLKDLSAADKMAVPTVRVSVQSSVLAIAAEKLYGGADLHHFDPMTVALGHPDALIALQSGSGSVNAHGSSPPYQEYEVKIPGVHVIGKSYDVLGGPYDATVLFSSARFHHANPKTYAAVMAALKEAFEIINRNHRNAALIYLQQSHEKWPLADVIAMLDHNDVSYSMTPLRTMRFADIMYRAGTIKTKASSWKEYFFPEIGTLAGS